MLQLFCAHRSEKSGSASSAGRFEAPASHSIFVVVKFPLDALMFARSGAYGVTSRLGRPIREADARRKVAATSFPGDGARRRPRRRMPRQEKLRLALSACAHCSPRLPRPVLSAPSTRVMGPGPRPAVAKILALIFPDGALIYPALKARWGTYYALRRAAPRSTARLAAATFADGHARRAGGHADLPRRRAWRTARSGRVGPFLGRASIAAADFASASRLYRRWPRLAAPRLAMIFARHRPAGHARHGDIGPK